MLLAVLFEFPLLERPFRLTALELLLPVPQVADYHPSPPSISMSAPAAAPALPQFTGAITSIANGPAAALASVALITVRECKPNPTPGPNQT